MKAISKFDFLLVTAYTIIFFSGCATIEQTIYLGDVNVNAPICPPPTHLNVNKKVGSVTISPKFSFIKNTTINGSTSDPYTGTFRFSNDSTYRAKTKNLQWGVSNYTFGADLDLKISQTFSIFGGINFSGNSTLNLTGGNFGIGFHTHNQNPIVRFDLGLTIQEYDFLAVTIVHTKTSTIFGGSDESWDIFGDKGKSTNINPFGTLTINSSNDSSLINWFVTGGYFTQNLLGFKPGTYSFPLFPFPIVYTRIDKRSDMLTGFLYVNPGITFSLSPEIKFVISVKMLNEVSATGGTGMLFMPSAQIDFQL